MTKLPNMKEEMNPMKLGGGCGGTGFGLKLSIFARLPSLGKNVREAWGTEEDRSQRFGERLVSNSDNWVDKRSENGGDLSASRNSVRIWSDMDKKAMIRLWFMTNVRKGRSKP